MDQGKHRYSPSRALPLFKEYQGEYWDGQRAAGEDQILAAASAACVDQDIQEFEKGYDTIVGERGVTLSGGQRQRIAIARTIARDVPILIFDDSLSAVDTETDAQIRKALKERRKNTTTIIISHRITTLSEADQILVLDRGSRLSTGQKQLVSFARAILSDPACLYWMRPLHR